MRTNKLLRWLAWCALLVAPACGADRGAGYGEIVRYVKDRALAFPDFTLRFRGARHVSHPVFKPGFTFYDFEVCSPKSTQTVSWSSGAGVIDSAPFKVDGRPYELELRGSVLKKKGRLRDDEVVVWPEARFLKMLEAQNDRS